LKPRKPGILLVAMGAAGLLAQVSSAVRVREAAPAQLHRWLDRPDGKPSALVFAAPGAGPLACPAVERAFEKVTAFGLAVTLIHPAERKPCPGLPDSGWSAYPDTLKPELLGIGPDRPELRLVIVDATGHVRLAQSFSTGEWPQLADVAVAWNAGRQAFELHCGHCHGDDGADLSYANIKSLHRISDRLSPAKIIQGGQDFGAVDLASWSTREIDALLLFIRGL
jgi:cytochrome c553